jgi:hypothetical protein
MIYPDLTVLLSLLVPGDQTEEASQLVRSPERIPLTLSIVHRLQVENSLLRYLHGPDARMSEIAREGLQLWQRYLAEGVFEIHDFRLSEAFAHTAAWNAEAAQQPPRWHLLIHVGLAATESASFMCLDPALRKRAKGAGVSLIPIKL